MRLKTECTVKRYSTKIGSKTYSTLKIMSVGSWHQDIAIGDFHEPKLQELLLCGRYKSRYNT